MGGGYGCWWWWSWEEDLVVGGDRGGWRGELGVASHERWITFGYVLRLRLNVTCFLRCSYGWLCLATCHLLPSLFGYDWLRVTCFLR